MGIFIQIVIKKGEKIIKIVCIGFKPSPNAPELIEYPFGDQKTFRDSLSNTKGGFLFILVGFLLKMNKNPLYEASRIS